MKRQDDSRPSLVEFLESIKFSRGQTVSGETDVSLGHFARLKSHTRRKRRSEDTQLIRSAN